MATKSVLFSRWDPLAEENNQFAKDWEAVRALTEPQRSACLEAIVPYLCASLPHKRETLLRQLEKDAGLPRIKLQAPLGVMKFFLTQLVGEETKTDTPTAWADDLLALGVLKEADRPIFESMTTALQARSNEYGDWKRRNVFSAGVFPSFKSCGHTVELRAIQQDKYDWGQDVGSYAPKITGHVPVASIHIGADAGTPDDFCFQADKEDIECLISELEAAKKDLEAFEAFVVKQTSNKD